MLFATSDIVWQALIAAGLAIVLAWMSQRAQAAAATAAIAAERVRIELAKESVTTRTLIDGTNHKLDGVVEQIHEVHLATNSLTDRLVETSKSEAFARGGKEERERADKAGNGK